MTNNKYKAHIKHLDWILPVETIDFKYKEVEVDLSDGQGDTSNYRFDEIELMKYVGMEDKNGRDMYEGELVKYTKIFYTKCSREEVQEVLEPVVGRLYYSEGIWLGIQFEDGSGTIFMPHTIYSEEFEILVE